jgi:transposase-like protein
MDTRWQELHQRPLKNLYTEGSYPGPSDEDHSTVRAVFAQLRQCKYLNNILEQDYRRIKHLTRPVGFDDFWTARRTLAGFEAMAF